MFQLFLYFFPSNIVVYFCDDFVSFWQCFFKLLGLYEIVSFMKFMIEFSLLCNCLNSIQRMFILLLISSIIINHNLSHKLFTHCFIMHLVLEVLFHCLYVFHFFLLDCMVNCLPFFWTIVCRVWKSLFDVVFNTFCILYYKIKLKLKN